MRFALLCIDSETKAVRRYVRNPYSKIWMTHESVLERVHDGSARELDEFRMRPESFLITKRAEAA